jgi:hypothetical protein
MHARLQSCGTQSNFAPPPADRIGSKVERVWGATLPAAAAAQHASTADAPSHANRVHTVALIVIQIILEALQTHAAPAQK